MKKDMKNTINKNNKSRAYVPDGSQVGFKLITETPENLYKHFIHKGWVKMYCKAKLDENLKPLELDVYDIENLNAKLPFGTNNKVIN